MAVVVVRSLGLMVEIIAVADDVHMAMVTKLPLPHCDKTTNGDEHVVAVVHLVMAQMRYS